MFWEGGAALIGQGLSFVVSLLLARLLAPEYFGLISIATLAISSLVFFQELGFSAALVYRQDDVDAAANTAHWTIIASSVVLYIIGFILAPLVARFFRSPEVTPILRVLALTIVISSLSRVSYTLLFKDMAFKKKVLPELLASLAGSVTSLLLALAGWKVWALVSGELVNASFATILVYLFYPWRPKIQFVRSLFREMFGYGKHIAASQILIFGITNVDDMFVGRMLGQAALGQYGLAYKISNLPATNITRLVTRVTFPAFTLLQGDIARMRGAFFRVVRYVSLLSIPVAVVTVIFAHDFVYFVLNPSWAPAIVPMQILAIYGLVRSISSNMGTIFQAGGKPQWLTSIAAWRFVTMTALLYPSIKWAGLVGCMRAVSGCGYRRLLHRRLSCRQNPEGAHGHLRPDADADLYLCYTSRRRGLSRPAVAAVDRTMGHRYARGGRPGRDTRVRRPDLVARSGSPPGSTTGLGADQPMTGAA